MTFWQIWWLVLAVKIVLLPILPITPDEAYYLSWARHLSLSYFDHPPFVAWLMALALPLWKTPLGIRLPGIVMSHLGFIPWYFILQKLGFSQRARILWILAIVLGPLTGLGGFIITPDVPLVFFWGLSMLALLWTVEKPSLTRWIILGVCLGLGLLSKYTMILFVPAAFLWLYIEGKSVYLRRAGPWVASLTALIVFSPVIAWNAQNHFASFAFQSHHGLGGQAFHWNFPIEYVSSQLGLLNPFVALAGLWVMIKYPRRNPFLMIFAVVPLVFFFLTSFLAQVEANWPVAAYPSFTALMATIIDHGHEEKLWLPWIKRGLSLSAVFVVLVISHTVHPWLPIPKDRDHTDVTREWLADVKAAKNYHPLFARGYQMAAFHSYYRPKEQEVFKLAGLDRRDFYDFLVEAVPAGPAYIILKIDDVLPEEIIRKYEMKNPRVLPSHLMLYDLAKKNSGPTSLSSSQVTQ